MHQDSKAQVTALLEASAKERKLSSDLLNLVYGELRRLAGRLMVSERRNHTLEPTALVHEAFLRLVDQSRVDWQGRTHFFAVAAQAMRRVLIDHARGKHSLKRGGDWNRVELQDQTHAFSVEAVDCMALDEAIRKLEQLDPRQSKVVEMRFFAGMSVEEVSEALGVSKRTVEGEWTHAKAWLRRELDR